MDLMMQLRDVLMTRGITCCENEEMSRHTSFQIGGPVPLLVSPADQEELLTCLREAETLKIRPSVIGAGSNLLIPDEGIRRVIIETRSAFCGIRKVSDTVIEADSGATLTKTAVFAAGQGLSGMEFAHGIPGTVGGGVFMNAGAYGGEMVQIVEEVDAADLSGRVRTIPASQLGFSYRHSVLMDSGLIVLRVRMRLLPGDPDGIREKMQELMNRRRTSQPLEYPSAGSTFKRPAGGYAAALIEEAGLKGRSVGGAMVSPKHAGFVINTGGATAEDVLALIRIIREEVQAGSGIWLEPEVQIWRDEQ